MAEPSDDTEAQLRDALTAAVAALEADGGTLHLLGPDRRLHLRACVPAMPESVLELIRTIPVGKGMAGLAVERARPVDACNIETDDSGDVRPGARLTGLKSGVAVPVFSGSEVIGALGVGNRDERSFTPEEMERLQEHGRALAAVLAEAEG